MNEWQEFQSTQQAKQDSDLSNPTLVNLADYGSILCTGTETFNFLQGQLATDLKPMVAQGASFAALLSLKGRVRALPLVSHIDQQWLLMLPQSLLQAIGKYLRNLGKLNKVEVKNVTNDWQHFAVIDEQVERLFNGLIFDKNLAVHQNCRLIKLSGAIIVQSQDSSALISVWQELAKQLSIGTSEHWHHYLTANRIPNICEENSEKFLAHPLRLDEQHMISVKKGCYVGQEIVARTHFKGKVKKHSYLAESELPLNVGAEILAEQKNVGEVIQSSGPLSLILINDEASTRELTVNGQQLRLLCNTGEAY